MLCADDSVFTPPKGDTIESIDNDTNPSNNYFVFEVTGSQTPDSGYVWKTGFLSGNFAWLTQAPINAVEGQPVTLEQLVSMHDYLVANFGANAPQVAPTSVEQYYGVLVDKFTAAYRDQLLQCALSNSHNKVHRESRCLQVYQSEW